MPKGIVIIAFWYWIIYYSCCIYDMVIVLNNRGKQGEDSDEMFPFFSIASRDFDKDLVILKRVYIN